MAASVPKIFNPEDLIKVAKALINNPSESEIRTILNRCYYACYLTVKKFEGKMDATDTINHNEVYNNLQNHKKSVLKTY